MKKYPVITVVGPRQSGKTTLCRYIFPHFRYISLEDLDIRELATHDPRGFFERYPGSLIIDEIQKVPGLTSYIQTRVDDPQSAERYVLTGSQNFLLIKSVSQSLAGRTRVFELLPLSQGEIVRHDGARPSINQALWMGGYPRIYDQEIAPSEWLQDYFRLYVERDIRSVLDISKLSSFESFVRLAAGRTGQLLNLESLGNEAGVSQPTAKKWIMALKETYICYTLAPFYKNFNKRIVKTPKLYFYDSGLLCYLLRITHPDQLDSHPLRGQIFENFVVSELMREKFNAGVEPNYYFWRDQKGSEVDLIEDRGTLAYPLEIKFSHTFDRSFSKGLQSFNELQKQNPGGSIIYASNESITYQGFEVRSWRDLGCDQNQGTGE